MPLELTQSRVQKIWVPVDHRPSLPRCECRQLRGGLGCRLRRVQSPAIVCAAALCRFPSAGSALVLAGPARRGGGGLRLPGWAEGALWLRKPTVCPARPELAGPAPPRGCSRVTLADCSRGAAALTNAPFSLGLLWFTVSFLPPSDLCTSVYFHLRRHSRDCRFLVAGMVYGLVTSVVLQTHPFTRSTGFADSFS